MSAFHGDPALRIAALQRLAARVEAKQLGGGPLAWDGEKGSVVGCLVESIDLQAWQEQLGLAKWLAHALDAVTGNLPPAAALEKTAALLNALPPGRDTGPLGSSVICSLLAEAASPLLLPEALKQALDAVSALHQRSLAGESFDAATWKTVRKQALAATDSFDEETQPRNHAIGSAIEAAAWDPQRSPMAVAEVLRQWLKLEGLKANEEFGWTEADDTHIRMLLARMHKTYVEPNPEATTDVFRQLEEHHPDDATRLRAYIKFGRDHQIVCVERAASLMVRLLETAP